MNDIFKQVLIGVTIAAIVGVWAFASTRASIASVEGVRVDVKELEVEIEDDIDKISANIDDIKEEVDDFVKTHPETKLDTRGYSNTSRSDQYTLANSEPFSNLPKY